MKPPVLESLDEGRYALAGPLVYATVAKFRPLLLSAKDPVDVINIDLAGVEPADSAGLALLVDYLREAGRRGQRVTFTNMPAKMLAIARVSGLDEILPLSR